MFVFLRLKRCKYPHLYNTEEELTKLLYGNAVVMIKRTPFKVFNSENRVVLPI
ncbi:hypothetical protein ALT1644_520017 [Alteromonas macleodii]